MPETAQHCCAEQGTIKALASPLPQNPQRTTVHHFRAVRQFIEEELDFVGRAQACNEAPFSSGQDLIK